MLKNSVAVRCSKMRINGLLVWVNLIAVLFLAGSTSFASEGALRKAVRNGKIDQIKQLLASGKIDSGELTDALGTASERGQLEIMKLLLDSGADANQISRDPWLPKTPLHLTLKRAKAVKLLLAHGADPTREAWKEACDLGYFDSARLILDRWVETPEGTTDIGAALIRDAIKGNTKQVRRILKSDTGKNISEGYRRIAFDAAVNKGYVEIVKTMIATGSRADAIKLHPDCVETPLDTAVDKGHTEVVRVLLDSGIDLKEMRETGSCFLESACMRGRIDIVKLLLDKGASANDGSALAAAAGESCLPDRNGGHLDIVKLLVERGADVNKPSTGCLGTYQSVTALEVAAREVHPEIVRYLLEKGANAKDERTVDFNSGDNMVTLAARKGHTEIVKQFLENGVDADRPTKGGMTALMAASSGGRVETAEFLLSRGAKVNLQDKQGSTALVRAVRQRHAAVARFLIGKGADPKIKNKEGLTALDIAERENLQDIAAILRADRPEQAPKR